MMEQKQKWQKEKAREHERSLEKCNDSFGPAQWGHDGRKVEENPQD